MTLRKVKRMLNESDDFLVFTRKDTGADVANFGVFHKDDESWEVLLNLAVSDYHIRETLRNVIKTADEYLENKSDSPEP